MLDNPPIPHDPVPIFTGPAADFRPACPNLRGSRFFCRARLLSACRSGLNYQAGSRIGLSMPGAGPGADPTALRSRFPGGGCWVWICRRRWAAGSRRRAGRLRLEALAASGLLDAAMPHAGRPSAVRRLAWCRAITPSCRLPVLPSIYCGPTWPLQWHATPDQVFPEWQRVLKVGGLAD